MEAGSSDTRRIADSGIHIQEVKIRYSFDGEVYELTIPETTRINAIYLDSDEAHEAMDAVGVRERVPLHPSGRGWDRAEVTANIQSLEKIPGVVWFAEHSRRALCIHDETCMWFCMEHS